jgi:hypothetical protein
LVVREPLRLNADELGNVFCASCGQDPRVSAAPFEVGAAQGRLVFCLHDAVARRGPGTSLRSRRRQQAVAPPKTGNRPESAAPAAGTARYRRQRRASDLDCEGGLQRRKEERSPTIANSRSRGTQLGPGGRDATGCPGPMDYRKRLNGQSSRYSDRHTMSGTKPMPRQIL